MGLDLGSVVQMFHRLAGLFKPVLPRLIERYRLASVRHADETSWRTDGRSGYAWLFCTPDLSIFMFRQTRSASVPRTREIMMSLLLTLKKRQQHAEDYFKSVLDRLSGDIKQDPLSLLFPADS